MIDHRGARLRKLSGRTLLYVFLVAFALLQLFPLIWLFNYSLVTSGELFGPELLRWPHPFQWANYLRAWVDGKIPRYLWNSTFVVVGSVTASTLFSFMIAYACTRMRWPLRRLVYGIVMLGMVIPIHTTLLPNFIWFRIFGLINRRVGLMIPYVAFTLSFNTLMFSGMLVTLPRSVEESAWIEGAGVGRLLASIVAPMVLPAFATVIIMTFLNNWNEFIMAYTFIASDRLRTLPFSIINFQGQYRSDYAIQFACMSLVAIIPIVLYFVFSKWIIAGATAGAVKA
jgi:raffinose/stachyose/melibiose transport system permease protein